MYDRLVVSPSLSLFSDMNTFAAIERLFPLNRAREPP
jgi:hypothetical protein